MDVETDWLDIWPFAFVGNLLALKSGEEVDVGGESTKTELVAEVSERSEDSALDSGECSACWIISEPRESSSAIPS